MNPLTLVKRIQKINSREAALGISEGASWHAKYKESAYVFVGGVPFDLTEGDLLAVFAQYGEIVDVNLVRDKATGKSKGFAFIAYEDQRSTNLAVDNLNGASVLGRIIRVDHVSNYKKKEEEDEEQEQQKREARGVCRAFQRGQCNRGAACKFSHNEQRCADTGWGPKESNSGWEHDKSEDPSKSRKSSRIISLDHVPDSEVREQASKFRSDDKNAWMPRAEDRDGESHHKRSELNPRDQDRHGIEKWSERYEKGPNLKDGGRHATEKRSGKPESKTSHDSRGVERSRRHETEPNPKEDRNRRRDERSVRHESDPNPREDRDGRRREEMSGRHGVEPNPKEEHDRRGGEKRSRYERDSSSHLHDDKYEVNHRRSHR